MSREQGSLPSIKRGSLVLLIILFTVSLLDGLHSGYRIPTFCKECFREKKSVAIHIEEGDIPGDNILL